MWCEVVHNKSILHGLFLVLGISLFTILILLFVYVVVQSGFQTLSPPHYSHIVSVINQPKQWDWTEQTKSKMSDLMNSTLKMFYRYCDNIVLLNFLCSSNPVLNVWYCIRYCLIFFISDFSTLAQWDPYIFAKIGFPEQKRWAEPYGLQATAATSTSEPNASCWQAFCNHSYCPEREIYTLLDCINLFCSEV